MRAERQKNYREGLEQRKKKRRGGILLAGIAAALVLALLSAGAWYALSGTRAEKRYADNLDEGNRYLIAMDYESAEFSYLRAIEAMPEEPEAYEKLANIYILQSRYEEAEELLARGVQSTGDQTLVKTYERVSALLQSLSYDHMTAETVSEDDLLRVSEGLTLDASIYDTVASYTYADYVETYGEPVSAADNSYGGRDLRFEGFPGMVSFRSSPYEENRADAVTFQNLSDLLGNYSGAASGEKLEELYGSEMQVTTLEREEGFAYYVSFTYHGCVISLASDENGNVYGNAFNVLVPEEDEILEEEEEEEEEEQGQRLASGHIINAVNGGSVQASLKFMSGGRYGAVELETSTESDGSFEAKLMPGQYTVEIKASGFITSYEEIIVSYRMDVRGLSFALSPELEQGQIRIVLTWGSYPRDLDSHLTGTDSTGKSISVNYTHLEEEDVASLDLDDTSGFGPETTTIYDLGGSYTFSVHNFSDPWDAEAFGNSSGQVRIYLDGGTEPIICNAPAGTGEWWDVCRIENGEVTLLGDLR